MESSQLFRVEGTRVFMTGGTGGIGTGLVGGFLNAGAKVCVAARSEHAIQETLAQFPQFKENLSFVTCDLNLDGSVLKAVEDARIQLGAIDTLILAHGNVFPGPALETSLESWTEQIQVNLTATFRIAQAVAPEMIARKSGKIITIASMLTFQGGLNASAYAASKGGVGQLTKLFPMNGLHLVLMSMQLPLDISKLNLINMSGKIQNEQKACLHVSQVGDGVSPVT